MRVLLAEVSICAFGWGVGRKNADHGATGICQRAATAESRDQTRYSGHVDRGRFGPCADGLESAKFVFRDCIVEQDRRGAIASSFAFLPGVIPLRPGCLLDACLEVSSNLPVQTALTRHLFYS
jgi:hypothetical protein